MVLDGLRSMLRKHRHEWDMSFVEDGATALEVLSRTPFDIIVTDLRMPNMDGAELLQRVCREHPRVVRIVLSGQTEQDAARRVAHAAHQFLAKPCEAGLLKDVVDRTCRLQDALSAPVLREAVGSIADLPAKPRVYQQLTDVMAKPSSSIADAAMIVESEPAIAAKVLQLVNSAFFNVGRRIGDVRTAVGYLGVEILKTLILDISVRQSREAPRVEGLDLGAIRKHGVLAARIARKLLPDRAQSQDAFSASLLKDVGWLVLAQRFGSTWQAAVDEARATGLPLLITERKALEITHSEVGAYLLGIWGLPVAIVEAVALHHEPNRIETAHFDVVGAVHVAGALAEEVSPSSSATALGSGCQLDEEYVARLGLDADLPNWRAMAVREAEASG